MLPPTSSRCRQRTSRSLRCLCLHIPITRNSNISPAEATNHSALLAFFKLLTTQLLASVLQLAESCSHLRVARHVKSTDLTTQQSAPYHCVHSQDGWISTRDVGRRVENGVQPALCTGWVDRVEVMAGIDGRWAYRRKAGETREPRMATTQEIKERIAAFARELAVDLGDVDDSDVPVGSTPSRRARSRSATRCMRNS